MRQKNLAISHFVENNEPYPPFHVTQEVSLAGAYARRRYSCIGAKHLYTGQMKVTNYNVRRSCELCSQERVPRPCETWSWVFLAPYQ
jgi:hypothetical protein